MNFEAISFMNSPAIRLIHENGSEAIIMLHGAHVVSWKPKDGQERIYLSPKTVVSPEGAIRGGIPVCFPQFSNLGPLPLHGFARNQVWRHTDTIKNTESVRAVFQLSDTPQTLTMWPHQFRAALNVTLNANALDVELQITNTGEETFSFTTALHTYLQISDIAQISIEGLKDARYIDKVANLEDQKEARDKITITEQTDRVYYNVPANLMLHEPGRSLKISTRNMPDAVIWNPWVERSQSIADLPDDAYKFMVCIEAGSIGKPIELAPNKIWAGSQTLIS